MPLLIGEDVYESDTFSYHSYPKLLETSTAFAAEKQHVLSNSDRVLYVGQRELATISPEVNAQKFRYIASDGATTCIIALLIQAQSKTVSLAHLDGSDTQTGVQTMVSEAKGLCDEKCEFDLYLLGGFTDCRGMSENLLNDILNTCAQLTDVLRLMLNATLEANTVQRGDKNYPLAYGLALDLNTCKLCVAESHQCCPDFPVREARFMYSRTNPLISIYNQSQQCITIPPYRFSVEFDMRCILGLPEDIYLKHLSTSPHCEPPGFVERGKSTIRFVLANLNNDLFHGESRKYTLTEQNEWQLLGSNKSYKLF